MKNGKKLLSLLLAMMMLVGILAGCTGNEDTTPSDEGTQAPSESTAAPTEGTTVPPEQDPSRFGGTLDVAWPSALTVLDPLKATGTWAYAWTTSVYENPLTRDAENQIAPGVCDYELSDDKLTLKLWVREGAKFHNGDDVDIYDVKASIDRAMVLRSNMVKKVAPYVGSMEIDDATATLTITFTEFQDAEMYYLASWETWCAVMPKEICEKYPDSLFATDVADAIGTGPYKVTAFTEGVELVMEKFEDYVPRESDRTGFAAPKYGYLDKIHLHQNKETSSVMIGLFSGDYDIAESMEEDYRPQMEENNIVSTSYKSSSGYAFQLNTMGENNVLSKYPSLRKAVMAAIDYEEFLTVVSGTEENMIGGQPPLDPLYETDVFEKADYFGATNMDAVAKYVAAAKEEGWNGTDPVICYCDSSRNDIITMVDTYLKKAEIPVEVAQMESASLSEFKNDPTSMWDMTFFWPSLKMEPTNLGVDIVSNYWISEEKDALLAEMNSIPVGSDEYVAKWQELAQVWVDDCATPYMGRMNWVWYHNKDLVTNDNETYQRYFYNAYWTDPSAHMD